MGPIGIGQAEECRECSGHWVWPVRAGVCWMRGRGGMGVSWRLRWMGEVEAGERIQLGFP